MTLSAIVTVPALLAPADFTAPIAGEPALVRAVRAVRPVAPVSVVAAEELAGAATECLAAHGLSDVPVHTAPGRLAEGDAVLVHDVRYPLAPAELAARVAVALPAHDAVIPVLTMTDSVKSVAAEGIVLGNVDRSELVIAQYPRGYTAEVLARFAPGDLAALISAGLDVGTVDGDPNAFAVDLTHDRELLDVIVSAG
ncbi:2-C-methyl-D-erythritol 4-phosphate cytidylyltransferase [Mycolicibacterium mucogenicum]|uniref:IspD/TarI family cytidylyltransferase n=1 Tax=Mycolicibacterium mucogenicum TaxID=56689 RepID=UPI00226A9BF2|nr:2-C-methyl-D-erythritol 4-phosphate cytidylyltransferase [Mycolicibacterium mucogenicum]MCX8563936.1 2-C-methyl-D-erythritol 4-phosphate cytidylyltransferase [Mycolicibacterium mucogenicum]